MSEENIFHNAEAEAIAKKVTLEVDPSAEKIFNEEKGLAIPSDVEIRTLGGRVYREKKKYSKGTPQNPFTVNELKEKFRILASSRFSKKRIEAIIEAVDSMETMKNISTLTKLLKVKEPQRSRSVKK